MVKLPVDYNALTPSERREVREQYIKGQKGRCAYCHELLSDAPPKTILSKKVTERLYPPNFFKWPVHLHHNHATGMTEGAVHAYCNAVSWEYEEN
jgi:hypothetical protein